MSIQEPQINWYPGHMAKARRQLSEQLKKIDLVIELCDARLPYSSRNPELKRMTAGKRRILLLNKADLADPEENRTWISFFRGRGEEVMAVTATRLNSKETMAMIERVTRELVEKALDKGIRKTIRAMIIGVPNVGKSTMINRLHGQSIVKTGDRPGVTRSSQWVKITPYLELMDTPGLLWPRLDDQAAARRLCYIGSVRDDVVDTGELTLSLLEEMKTIRPDMLMTRFHLTEEELGLEGVPLLDAVCRGRGWLLRGNRFDYDRCFSVVLDEFRAGKLGRITLEKPGASGAMKGAAQE